MENPFKDKAAHKEYVLEMARFFIARQTAVMILKSMTNDQVLKCCTSVPEVEDVVAESQFSNIGVKVGKEHNLLAIKGETGSGYLDDSAKMLAELEAVYGKLTSTMTIQYPGGCQYKLYEYPSRDVLRGSLASGLKVISKDVYGFSEVIMLPPSELTDGKVQELSRTMHIAQLPDKWVDYVCGDPWLEEVVSDDFVEVEESIVPVLDVSCEECSEQELVPMVVDAREDASAIEPVVVKDQAVEESYSGQEVSPDEYIQLVVVKMVMDGVEPKGVIARVLALCTQHRLALSSKDIFMLVYAEFCKVDRYAGASSGNESLMRFVADVELEVFRDHHKELCCKIVPAGEIVVLSTRASKISQYLNYRVVQLTNAMPKDAETKTVLKMIEAVGQFESREVKMFNRVGNYEGDIYYDLGDVVAAKITGAGWQVVDAPPIFRRYANHKAQVTPKAGGRIEKFFEFVNHEEGDRLLLAVYLVASFIPQIAHPVLYVYGDHGSAKSSLSAKIKAVIDPGTVDRLILNNKKEEVVRNLKQNYVSHYDNISLLTNEISDVFCIASTGGGMDNRKLYTDEESSIMSFKHCVVLNGIKLAIKKPDLLDRSILVRLKRLQPTQRKSEEEINSAFESALPEILGGIFDTISKAVALYPDVKLTELPRMADFARWGYAIAEALGGYGERFIAEYKQNIADQNNLIAGANTLAHAVLQMMENKSEWHTTIKKAYDELKKIANTDRGDRSFPVRDNDLRGYLEELGPVLDSFGVNVSFGTTRRNYGWTVKFTNSKVAEPGATGGS